MKFFFLHSDVLGTASKPGSVLSSVSEYTTKTSKVHDRILSDYYVELGTRRDKNGRTGRRANVWTEEVEVRNDKWRMFPL